MISVSREWARATTSRMKPGGDLYRRPWTRAAKARAASVRARWAGR